MKNDLTKTLKNESKDRKKMMEEVTNNLDTYSFLIIELENKIKEYELEEIKYKNLERESKELTKIYELKLEDLNNKTTSLENELKQTRMELVNEKTISKNLKSFLENIYLSKNTSEKMIFYIKIEDNIIKDNSNVFKWEVSNNFSSLEVCENFKNINSVVKLNISTLTSWIFGYISLNSLILENYVQCENKDILNKLSLIKIIDGIFLDEIV